MGLCNNPKKNGKFSVKFTVVNLLSKGVKGSVFIYSEEVGKSQEVSLESDKTNGPQKTERVTLHLIGFRPGKRMCRSIGGVELSQTVVSVISLGLEKSRDTTLLLVVVSTGRLCTPSDLPLLLDKGNSDPINDDVC